MNVTPEYLRERYNSMDIEELARLYHAGGLTEAAVGVLREVITARGLDWARFTDAETDWDEFAEASATEPGSGLNLDEFISHYYEHQQTEHVANALEQFLEVVEGLTDHMRQTTVYAFGRIGQLAPELVPEYEELFCRHAAGQGWSAVLAVLRWTANPQTMEFLRRCQSDAHSDEVSAAIANTLENWSQSPPTALDVAISGPGDLDFVWMEFCVTGREEAVEAIIEVLARPDRVRARVENWLTSSRYSGLFARLRRQRRGKKLAELDIYLDSDSKSVLSTRDMDLCCVMDGVEMSERKFNWSRSVLPFRLSPDDLNHIAVKGAAMWSLSSFCYGHPTVLNICDAESRNRVGTLRLTLLEIQGRVSIALGDLETALNKPFESLDPQPAQRRQYLEECEQRFRALIDLSNEGGKRTSTSTVPAGLVTKCVEVTRQATTYCSKMYKSDAGIEQRHPYDWLNWRLEYAKPDRFRVLQIAGQDADEWVTIERRHYRGPMYIEFDQERESAVRLNQSLLVDQYLDVMTTEIPDSIQQYDVGEESYFLLAYAGVESSKLLSAESSDQQLIRVNLWVDARDRYVARVDILFQNSNHRIESRDRLHLMHLFTNFGGDILIVPPAFQLMEMK